MKPTSAAACMRAAPSGTVLCILSRDRIDGHQDHVASARTIKKAVKRAGSGVAWSESGLTKVKCSWESFAPDATGVG